MTSFNCFINVVFFYLVLSGCTPQKGNEQAPPVVSTNPNTSEKMYQPSQNGHVNVNGIRMYYEIYGKGKPLVLIHGGGSTIQSSFSKIIPILSQNRQVIGVELQAHGRTTDRDTDLSFEQDADDVAALLLNLKINKADFFGFSNGGSTAMQIAIRHPEMVNKLILASACYKREGLIPGFFDGMKSATLKDMPASLQAAFMNVTPDSHRLLTMFNKDKKRMLEFKDWNDADIRSIHVPTLIINGDKDVILPSHAVAMAGLMPYSRLMILPVTHGAYMGVTESDDPDGKIVEFTMEAIEDFLEKE